MIDILGPPAFTHGHMAKKPKSLSPFHPVTLIVTCFGLGHWRFLTPDVSGSLLAMLIVVLAFPNPLVHDGLFLFSAVCLGVAWLACGFYFQHRKDKDMTDIAVDGFIGMLATIVFFYGIHDFITVYPLSNNRLYALFMGQPYFALCALFLLFRFFHGWRVGFARITSTGIRSATGVMIEALSGAVLAAGCMHGILILSEYVQRPGVW